MSDFPEEENQVSFWPSISDLFMTLFIVIVALLGAVFYVLIPKFSPGSDRQIVQAVGGTDMNRIKSPVNRMRESMGLREPLRPTLQPGQVVAALEETSEDVVKHFKTIPDVVALQRENTALKSETERLKALLEQTQSQMQRASEDAAKLSALAEKLKADLERTKQLLITAEGEINDKPPIIRIDEAAKEYRFPSGSAEMGSQFTTALTTREFQTLAAEITRRNAGGVQRVDTIEIIGHTDGRPISVEGNLDAALPVFLSSSRSAVTGLRPGSNNDLGLLRALSVRRAWEQFVSTVDNNTELQKIAIRCYSAGQTLPEGVDPADPRSYQLKEERLRRIELRLTKLAISVGEPTKGDVDPQ